MQCMRQIKLLSRTKRKYGYTLILKNVHSNLEISWRENTIKPTFKDYKNFIINNLGIDNEKAQVLLQRSDNFLEIPIDKIVHSCQICQEQHVDMQKGLNDLKFLELTEEQLEERIIVLREMGAEYITTAMISRCGGRAHVVSFKAFARIPKTEDISKRLYSLLHTPPASVPSLQPISETISVNEYRKIILIHYLKWRLEFTEDQESILENSTRKLRNKSFAKLKHSFDVLHDDCELSIEVIRNKKCLENTSATDLQRILNELKTVCGVEIKKLIKYYPDLHKMRYKNVEKAKYLLELNNFTKEHVENCPQILLLETSTLVEGLEAIKNTPELQILVEHPSALQILLAKEGISRRVDYLRYLDSQAAFTVKVLGSSLSKFESYLKNTRQKYKFHEIFTDIEKRFSIDSKKLRDEFKKHPMWRHANVVSVHKMRDFLLNNFSVDEVKRNLQLLFYSRDRVEEVCLALIEMNKSLEEKDRYTNSQILSLCIYEIEKNYHFSGEGIWDNITSSNLPENSIKINENTGKECQVKYPLNDVNIFLFIDTNKNQLST